MRTPVKAANRVRDLFPLPLVPVDDIQGIDGLDGSHVADATAYIDGVVVA